jgi:hypothetical protein
MSAVVDLSWRIYPCAALIALGGEELLETSVILFALRRGQRIMNPS